VKNWKILPIVLLLLQGCEKSEEKHASVSAPPKPAERLKPVGSGGEERRSPVSTGQPGENPQGAAPTAPPPSAKEIAAFDAALASFTKKSEPLLNTATPDAAVDEAALQNECTELLAQRAKLMMTGMELEQKKELAKKSFVIVRVRNALLKRQTDRNPPAAPGIGDPLLPPGLESSVPAAPPTVPPAAPGTEPAPQ
jgi:hypothetical protein